MLGLILLYFIWKYYSELAFDHKKNRWLYAMLGILSYYGGTFAGGMIIGIIAALTGSDFVERTPEILLGLMAMPFGILTVFGLYKILERNWTKQANVHDLLDNDLKEK